MKENLLQFKDSPQPLYHDGEVIGFGCSRLSVQTISTWMARDIIVRHHYSGKFVNNSRIQLGVYVEREFVGVLQLGYIGNPKCAGSIVENTDSDEHLELNRMWIHDKAPRNTESRALSFAFKYIKLAYPKIQWVQSFADERCGRWGVVYQAANFLFIGSHTSKFYELDGQYYHQKILTCKTRGGTKHRLLLANRERLKTHKYQQFRYIIFLKRGAIKRLRYEVFPYPKPEAGEVSKARRRRSTTKGQVRSLPPAPTLSQAA